MESDDDCVMIGEKSAEEVRMQLLQRAVGVENVEDATFDQQTQEKPGKRRRMVNDAGTVAVKVATEDADPTRQLAYAADEENFEAESRYELSVWPDAAGMLQLEAPQPQSTAPNPKAQPRAPSHCHCHCHSALNLALSLALELGPLPVSGVSLGPSPCSDLNCP